LRIPLLAAFSLAALLLAACSGGRADKDKKSDWEIKNERFLSEAAPDAVPPLPPYPKNEDLLPFFVSSASDFKFFVDRRSISVKDGQVLYTMVARSPNGVDNISYEALNCKEREVRSYARGASGGTWITRPTPWRKIDSRGRDLAQYALHWEYLCPNNIAVYNAAEGVSALEKGGHAWSKMPNSAGGAGSR
jgi:hypothetical protein